MHANQGIEIRELKKSKPDKAALQPHIDILLALKMDYKAKTGKDYAPAPGVSPAALSPPKTATSLNGGGSSGEFPGGEVPSGSPVVAELYAKITAKVITSKIPSCYISNVALLHQMVVKRGSIIEAYLTELTPRVTCLSQLRISLSPASGGHG